MPLRIIDAFLERNVIEQTLIIGAIPTILSAFTIPVVTPWLILTTLGLALTVHLVYTTYA